MFRRRRAGQTTRATPPREGRYVREEEEIPPPPPRRPLIWPWLLLLLLLVGAALAAAYFLTRDDDSGSSQEVPNVVGDTMSAALRELGQRGYPADVRRQVSESQVGRVLSQDPDAGSEHDRGDPVVIVVGRSSSTVDVPAVAGMTVADAFERLQAAQLRGREVKVDSPKRKGIVVTQKPAARSEAPKNSVVVLRVSKGPRLVVVPLVEGLRQSAAMARLKRAGFDSKVLNVPSQEPAGTVVAQSPQAGRRARAGSTVQINVAGAASPGSQDTTPTTGTATIPNVVGKQDTEAVEQIKKAGFRVQSTAVSSTQPVGTVLTQSPAGGTVARRGTTVRLTVSGGPRVRVVPNVVGQTETIARRTLRNAGFVTKVMIRAVTDPAQDGVVVDQDPAAGTRVQGSTEVIIFVGRLT